MELTEEKREEYIKIKDEYHKKQKDIGDKVKLHLDEIQKQKSTIDNLLGGLKVPVLENCDGSMKCGNCGIYSMEFIWTQPGQGERFHWYKCVLCNHEDYCT